jgi:hypothetical protein
MDADEKVIPAYDMRGQARKKEKMENGSPVAEPKERVPGDLRYAPRRKRWQDR